MVKSCYRWCGWFRYYVFVYGFVDVFMNREIPPYLRKELRVAKKKGFIAPHEKKRIIDEAMRYLRFARVKDYYLMRGQKVS